MVRTEIAEISFDESTSILHIKMFEDAKMDLENTVEHYDLIKSLTSGKKHLVLVDATHFFSIDEKALQYAAQPETTKNRIATAYFTTHLGNRFTTNFFKTFYKPNLPVQSFKTKQEALEWLKTQL